MQPDIKRILIADDDDGIVDMLKLWFDTNAMFAGVAVSVVKSPQEAKMRILEETPDMVFLDLGLGNGVSGLDLLKELKSIFNVPARIFVFSGYNEYEKECLNLGAAAFIKKGTRLKDIERIIRESFKGPPGTSKEGT